MSNVEIQERASQIMVISGLNPPDKKPINRLKGHLSERFYRFATQDWEKRYGVKVYYRRPDYRTSEALAEAREELSNEIAKNEISLVVGSSAGGNEAIRLVFQHNKNDVSRIKGVSNQGRLRRGKNRDTPTLEEAAVRHRGFYEAVMDFEGNILPNISESDSYHSIGANRDTVVPRRLKSLNSNHHSEVYVSRFVPGFLTHAVAIYKGIRKVPEVLNFS